MKARSRQSRCRGVAAIELALVMAGIGLLVPSVLVMGSVFAQYAALNKAVHEGARYMASLPPQALAASTAPQSVTAARALVQATMTASGASASLPSENIFVRCGSGACFGLLPNTVNVSASIAVSLPGGLFMGGSDSGGLMLLQADHTLRYAYVGAGY